MIVYIFRADANGNQLLETNELAEWIRQRVIEHITTSVRNNFGLFSIIDNNPKNNLISWDEYHAYFLKKRGFNTDYIDKHDEVAHGGLKRPLKGKLLLVNCKSQNCSIFYFSTNNLLF